MSDNEDKLPDELRRALKTVLDHFEKEDRYVRERQLRTWKKLKYYWSGFSRLWWSEVAHDWRVYDLQQAQNLNEAAFYDKPINVFRAYMESIISALGTAIPAIKCYPDNSDNPNDLLTAKAGDKIAELVSKHNNVPLLWIHALFIYCTEGMVACYAYPKEDKKYGTYNKQNYVDDKQERDAQVCPDCGNELTPNLDNMQFKDAEAMDEFQPDEDNNQSLMCETCEKPVENPKMEKKEFYVRRMTGITQEAKSRQCMEVYGGLNVQIPNYARTQEECPYLIYKYETNYVCAIEEYKALKDLYKEGGGSGGIYDPYERWARLSTQYFGEYPMNIGTFRKAWLRPSAFNILQDEEHIKKLKKRFPNGCKVVFWNETYCESEAECLDDCWTITHNPLSDFVHFDPLGMLVTSVQDITSDLISLTLQTIEHGVSITFADPEVLNFQQYRQTEVAPGDVFPAKPKSGKSIADGFHDLKTATLGAEVKPFGEKVQELGEFASGALPSLSGGAAESGSKTAAEYAMSRAQAMGRQQTPWKMFSFWWKDIYAKVIPAFIQTMQDDEHYTKKDSLGGFVTVMIRKAEIEGKIGSVELEANEQIPMTWSQKKDVIMQLISSPNPELMQALTLPENIPILADAIGLTDFEVPGNEDRTKQYEEIALLADSQPIVGPQGEMPSVDIDVLVDDHKVEASICRRFLVSEAGRQLKIDKPQGYRNILLHMQHHMMVLQKNAMQQQQQQNPSKQGNVPPQKPALDNPQEGDGNAQPTTIQ